MSMLTEQEYEEYIGLLRAWVDVEKALEGPEPVPDEMVRLAREAHAAVRGSAPRTAWRAAKLTQPPSAGGSGRDGESRPELQDHAIGARLFSDRRRQAPGQKSTATSRRIPWPRLQGRRAASSLREQQTRRIARRAPPQAESLNQGTSRGAEQRPDHRPSSRVRGNPRRIAGERRDTCDTRPDMDSGPPHPSES
jgi:hypothetical protein